MDSKAEKISSLVTYITFLASSVDWDAEFSSLFTQLLSQDTDLAKIQDLEKQICSLKPKMELLLLTRRTTIFMAYRHLDAEWKVVVSLFTQIVTLVSSMDLCLEQAKPESELISLIKQTISMFNSKPASESELVSLITQIMHLGISLDSDWDSEILSLIRQLVSLKPEQELTSLIKHTITRFKSSNWERKQLVSLCPQAAVRLEQGKLRAPGEYIDLTKPKKGECVLDYIQFFISAVKDHFYCNHCKGDNHQEYEKAPVEVKHSLHPKHSLQLVWNWPTREKRECYCCDVELRRVIYYCEVCDYAMNIACLKKATPVLPTDHPKWHDHPLFPFPSHLYLPCNLCALTHPSSLFYICPPCDFVVHQKCLRLPHVIRISRHTHRISFTPCFDKGDWFCGVCRTKINNSYGGYSCIKDGCSFVAHSKCATQSNVWDGEELEGVPEEFEEEVEPFVTISHGIIQHFSHQQHHLTLDENMGRDYDENKLCEACVTPIYIGNFYSCIECEFLIHEKCANLPRRIYHPIHPHLLTLVIDNSDKIDLYRTCVVCPSLRIGFLYECGKEECDRFKLHVQCAAISEPLVHGTHTHPLFLTSKPGEEERTCGVCKKCTYYTKETFNCIECDYSVCFPCATLPQKVRYKHDKHMLTLSYGEETSTMEYWCEACETKIKQEEGFYKCDEYCCVTIHIECLIGRDFYMKPSLLLYDVDTRKDINVLPNNHHMSRPICSECKKRCRQKIVFKCSGATLCSNSCLRSYIRENFQNFYI